MLAARREPLSQRVTGATYLDSSNAGPGFLVVPSGEFVSSGPIEWSSDSSSVFYTGLTSVEDLNPVTLPDLDLRKVSLDGSPSQLVASGVEWFDLRQ